MWNCTVPDSLFTNFFLKLNIGFIKTQNESIKGKKCVFIIYVLFCAKPDDNPCIGSKHLA